MVVQRYLMVQLIHETSISTPNCVPSTTNGGSVFYGIERDHSCGGLPRLEQKCTPISSIHLSMLLTAPVGGNNGAVALPYLEPT